MIKYKHTDLSRRPKLLLPDGRRAIDLRLRPLLVELRRLDIPGIDARMGKGDLLAAYEAHIAAVAETISPEKVGANKKPDDKRPKDISAAVARQAAALIEQQARQGG